MYWAIIKSGSLVLFRQNLIKDAVVQPSLCYVPLSPVQAPQIGNHNRVRGILPSVKLVGSHLDPHFIVMPVHPTTRTVVIFDVIGTVKCELGDRFLFRHFYILPLANFSV